MEATIYEESPLADYLEGCGEAAQDPAESLVPSSLGSPISFAPRGPPRSLTERLREALPHPLQLESSRAKLSWIGLQTACKDAVRAGISRVDDERYVEQFRYLIIASQLLDHQSGTDAHAGLRPNVEPLHPMQDAYANAAATFSLTGVAATALFSFGISWSLHHLRRRKLESLPKVAVTFLLLCAFVLALSAICYIFVRRKSSQRLRQAAKAALTSLLDEFQAFDNVSSACLKLIQEVEIVSRGYEITFPLAPITRLEQGTTERRCAILRAKLTDKVVALTRQCREQHESLHCPTFEKDTHQYYEIYDISIPDYEAAMASFGDAPLESRDSLQMMRLGCSILSTTRKILLCGLLAIPADPSSCSDQRWHAVAEGVQCLALVCNQATQEISNALIDQESREWGAGSRIAHAQHVGDKRQTLDHAKSQMRRLDGMSNGIRALHAKMLLLREEVDTLVDANEDSTRLTSALSRQYDTIGHDLRGLLTEWEHGRTTMMMTELCNRFSRSSSGFRSPLSPSPSLGGRTAVEDGPADALRVLNGEDISRKLSDFNTSDEEVFEAVSAPRMRTSMTREEKMAKMQEDRRKRATMQESREATTHMLKELETVIKHRPRGRTTSRIPTSHLI